VIDNDPRLLEQSYQLRYQVYCLERGFLPAEDYPDHREVDQFDPHSVHIGVMNMQNELLGTARLVQPSGAGLPLFDHCTLFDDAPPLDDPPFRVIETSRLAVSREDNRGQGVPAGSDVSEGRKSGEIVLEIYKGVYQESKRRGFTHWLAATEKSLQRLMVRYGFPWKAVGPETDYYGAVSPYLMNVREFDNVILSGRISVLDRFLDGLESEFMPRDIWELVEALR
jgi:N-acyl amino acid synthase of PEP-CTERM/exosortase system